VSLIHIGGGIHVEVEEGGLRVVPRTIKPKPQSYRPKIPARTEWKCPKLAQTRRERHPMSIAIAEVPGTGEWRGREIQFDTTVRPPDRRGGIRRGSPNGISEVEFYKLRNEVINTLMNDDKIKELIASVDENDPVAGFALGELIKLAALPGSARDRMAILKTLLEFTKSKPVTKSEIAVAQQDTWAMLLNEAEEDAKPKNGIQ
jgi:hypothetical protein